MMNLGLKAETNVIYYQCNQCSALFLKSELMQRRPPDHPINNNSDEVPCMGIAEDANLAKPPEIRVVG